MVRHGAHGERRKAPETEGRSGPAELFRASLAGKFSLVLLALLLPLVFVGLSVSRGLSQNADELLRARLVKELATRSLSLILTQDDVTKEILLDMERISEAQRKIDAYDENREVMDRIAELSRSPDLLETLESLRAFDEERLRPLDSAVLETLTEQGAEAAQELYFQEYQPARHRYVALAELLIEQAEEASGRAELALARADRRSMLEVVLALLVGIGLVAAVALAISRHVARRLALLARTLDRLAWGDLREPPVVDSRDEIGRIAAALGVAMTGIGDALVLARSSAREVQGGSKGIARAAGLLARTASDQRAELGKASESVGEMTARVWEIAERARVLRTLVHTADATIGEIASMSEEFRQSAGSLTERIEDTSRAVAEMKTGVAQVSAATDRLSEGADATASRMLGMSRQMESVDRIAAESAALWERMVARGEEARDKVRQTADGVETIRASTRDAEQVVKGVGVRAQEIGKVLDVIHDVADETKLLALNAAIIAAQAGGSGKAFSVVASEIKELAQRVSVHTKEVDELIRGVQDESANAIEAMDRGASSVDQLAVLSSQAGEAVDEITHSSQQSGEQIRRIADEVRSQSRASREIVEEMRKTEQAVGEIRGALASHGESHEVLLAAAGFMDEAAKQICNTALQLVDCTDRISDGIRGVNEASEAVESALHAQSVSTQSIAEFLDKVGERSSENSRSAQLTSDATQELSEQADALHERVMRFALPGDDEAQA